MRHALLEEWITANPAPNIKIGKKGKRKADEDGHASHEHEERYGLSEEEYGWVEEEARLWGNPRRAKELHAILLLLRHSGIRISDGATLDLGEIVQRESGKGHAIHLRMMKTGSRVYVPIPDEVYRRLVSLGVKGEKNGKKYTFWTAKGKMSTCIKNFANDIAELMHRAQRPKKTTIKGLERNYALQNYARPFKHRASTHSLRHTFATLALASGVPIQTVSRWLGHKNIRTTEKFYIHACPELKIQSDQSYEQMMERSQGGRVAHVGQKSIVIPLPLQ
jgi:integrase